MDSTPNSLRKAWILDPEVNHLNHGSFGACPAAVLQVQHELRQRMEKNTMQFLLRELEGRLDAARAELAAFIGGRADDLAFVPNATTAANAVLRSLPLATGDEIVITNHGYNAASNAVRYAAERAGARVVLASVPFPVTAADEVLAAVMGAVGAKTRLVVIDHVTSPTALVWPVATLVEQLQQRGIDVFIDGAHVPGMLPLNVDEIGAAYYTGNCHKWLCAPKGAAFLHVRRDRQAAVRPTSISHGANAQRTDRSRFRLEFDWTGTDDPTPFLCVPECIRYLPSLVAGGWPAIYARNRSLALEARNLLADIVSGGELAAPENMLGSMAALLLSGEAPVASDVLTTKDPLQALLAERFRIEAPVFGPPIAPRRVLRVSAHLYNERQDYLHLADALRTLRSEGLT